MHTLHTDYFGIVPEKEIGAELISMLDFARDKNVSHILFQKGTYYIDVDSCQAHMLYITNTLGDGELPKNETPHLQKTAIYLNGLHDITIDGDSSVFVLRGKMTNLSMVHCQNITLKNIELRHAQPDMHELCVRKKTPFSVEFDVDSETKVEFKGGKPYFYGKGFSYPADKGASTANWIPLIKKGSESSCQRVRHPLSKAIKYKEEIGGFTAYYLNTARFDVGDRFYIYDVIRQYVGIFINECQNVSLINVKQSFNHSLAVVMQCSENITVKDCTFAPEENSPRLMASCADFIQSSMCRGFIRVENCEFKGAGDDCINVHGIHFIVTEINGNEIKLKYMHNQTHGFNPFRDGDTVGFISPKSLREKSQCTVVSSRLINEYELILTLGKKPDACVNDAVENISACPEVYFCGNTISRIVTRGVLLTTRGKSEIKNNRFISTAMSSILLSDDANAWYESGMCKDVLIKDNIFDFSGEPTILIKPENRVHSGAVHENIRIENNTFPKGIKCCVSAKSTDNITIIKNNEFNKGQLKTKSCGNVTME